MKTKIIQKAKDLAGPILVVAVIIILWEFLVQFFSVAQYLVPTPSKVALIFINRIDVLMCNAVVTLQETLAGFCLAVLLGVVSAMGITYSKFLKRSFYPIAVAFQGLPKTALAPLFIVWFGVGMLPKVVMALIIAYFPVMINMAVGIGQIDEEMLELARSMNATEIQIVTKIRLPHSMPYFFSSLKIALPLSIVGAVVAEFIASVAGLGNLILITSNLLNTPLLFASLTMLMITSTVILVFIMIIESIVLRWQPK